MKDIGLGILDPYTVVIVLVTLVLAQVLLGYPVPLDTTNATSLFISLVLFTGYIYAARSLVRLPFVAVYAMLYLHDLNTSFLAPFKPLERGWWRAFRVFFANLFFSIVYLPVLLLYVLVFALNFASTSPKPLKPYGKLKPLLENSKLQTTLILFDRLSVAFIALVAVLPAARALVPLAGVAGLVFMLFVYVLKGSFAALIADALEKGTETQPGEGEVAEIVTEPMPVGADAHVTRLDGIQVTASHCLVCGKTSTANEDGRVPKLCSLECELKWYASWDKDWCIRDGEARQLLNQVRRSQYADLQMVKDAAEQLQTLPGREAIWALMAMVRDTEALPISIGLNDTLHTAPRAALEFLVEKRSSAVSMLNACLLDENPAVVRESIRLLAQKVPVNLLKVEALSTLLKSRDWEILQHAITVAGKLGQRSELLTLAENNNFKWEYEEYAVIEALAGMNPPAIYELKRLQRHRSFNIRENATGALHNLRYRLQQEDPHIAESPDSPLYDIEEPSLVVEKVACPRCKRRFPVDVPKEVDILKIDLATWRDKLSRKTKLIVECPRCHRDIFVDTGQSTSRQMVEAMAQARNQRQDFYYQDEHFQPGSDRP